MDFSLTEEQQAVLELARQIFADYSAPEQLRGLERQDDPQGPFDASLWAALAEAGLLSIGIPEAYGGAGLDFVATTQVALVAGETAAYVPVVATMVAGADTIARFGTTEQKALWLPQIASGEVIATAATAELTGGVIVDALSSLSTTAKKVGEGYVLNGVKACVPAGLRAQIILIPAAIEGAGIGVFVVESSSLEKERQEGTFQPEALLTLRDVNVSGDRLLGGDGANGAEIVSTMAINVTAALCMLEAGAVTAAVNLGAQYTAEREQFGKKIATFQAVGQRLADAYVDAEAIRLTALQAAWRIATGVDAKQETEIAKFWAAEGGQRVVHAATHVHGGVGVDRDYPLHRYFLLTRQIELTLGGATKNLLALGSAASTK